MEGERQKIELELLITGDGRAFLNRWDFMHGNDTCAEIKEGELYIEDRDENISKVSLQEFLNKVLTTS